MRDLVNMEMGTYFEGSDDVIVVTAKHIGTLGKAPLMRMMLGLNGSVANGVINASAICQVDAVPSMQEYYKGNEETNLFHAKHDISR
jgi:hypothetical protein